jgi:hypothetical protein
MEGPTSKKTKEPPKRANHKGNINFLNPLLSREGYQIRKGGQTECTYPTILHQRKRDHD